MIAKKRGRWDANNGKGIKIGDVNNGKNRGRWDVNNGKGIKIGGM